MGEGLVERNLEFRGKGFGWFMGSWGRFHEEYGLDLTLTHNYIHLVKVFPKQASEKGGFETQIPNIM